jgi:DNA-binding NarL/FixJ family response regulator
MQSTIGTKDLFPEALNSVCYYMKIRDTHQTIKQLGTHITADDIAMEAVEKVLKANPLYLTKTYVRLAVKCVLMNYVAKGKLQTLDIDTVYSEDDDSSFSIEDTLEGNTYQHLVDMEILVLESLKPEEQELYKALSSNELYCTIAERLKISTRTLERNVRALKDKINYLLGTHYNLEHLINNGCNPDDNVRSLD